MSFHSSLPAAVRTRWAGALLATALLIATFAAYSNSFNGPFLLDDRGSILENPTIRHLAALGQVMSPPPPAGVGGRPFVNLSLAVNYALSGLTPRGYHVVNFAIHALAGMTLLGLVRRTLLRPALRERFGPAALPLAGAIAGWWLLHPLQTNVVDYVSQRAESLMALFYLLTLYCFVRGVEAKRRGWWYGGIIAACTLGMASKEVMVTAPLLVLLYDRTFVAGSFRMAWRARWRWYLALAGTWWLLAWLLQGLDQRGAGFATGLSPAVYALTSCQTMLHYLRLSFWPHPLVFDYGPGYAADLARLWPYVLAVAALVGGTGFAFWRRPALGFWAVWFLVILAPTTSFVPVAFQPVAENRVYLPLAGVLVLAVLGLYAWLGRRSAYVLLGVGLACGGTTLTRNRDYRDAITLWNGTLARRPDNPRAHDGLGFALVEAGRPAEAIPHYEAALALQPDYPEARSNLGNALAQAGRLDEAIAQFHAGLAVHPDKPQLYFNLGNAFLQAGRREEARAQFAEALRLRPDDPEAAHSLGNTLRNLHRPAEAIPYYELTLRLRPDFPEAHYNFAVALNLLGRTGEALDQVQQALRLDPAQARAHRLLGDIYTGLGRTAEARASYELALRLAPNDALAHYQLGQTFAQSGQMAEARNEFEQAARLQPGSPDFHHFLALALTQTGDVTRALTEFQTAIRLKPDYAQARNNYAAVLESQGRIAEAIAQLEAAVRADPGYLEARENLARLKASMPGVR